MKVCQIKIERDTQTKKTKQRRKSRLVVANWWIVNCDVRSDRYRRRRRSERTHLISCSHSSYWKKLCWKVSASFSGQWTNKSKFLMNDKISVRNEFFSLSFSIWMTKYCTPSAPVTEFTTTRRRCIPANIGHSMSWAIDFKHEMTWLLRMMWSLSFASNLFIDVLTWQRRANLHDTVQRSLTLIFLRLGWPPNDVDRNTMEIVIVVGSSGAIWYFFFCCCCWAFYLPCKFVMYIISIEICLTIVSMTRDPVNSGSTGPQSIALLSGRQRQSLDETRAI